MFPAMCGDYEINHHVHTHYIYIYNAWLPFAEVTSQSNVRISSGQMEQPQLGCFLSVPAFAAGPLAVKEIVLPMQEETTDMNLPQMLPYLFCHEDFSCCLTTGRWYPQGRGASGTHSRTPGAAKAHWGSHSDTPWLWAVPCLRGETATAASIRDETRQDIQQLSTEASQLAILECTDRWLVLFLPPLLQAHSFSAILLITETHVPKTSSPFSWACQLVWQDMLPFSKPPL